MTNRLTKSKPRKMRDKILYGGVTQIILKFVGSIINKE